MKKAAIFYFSGTGNTWWVANTLCDSLSKKGVDANIYSIESVTCEEAQELIDKSDIIGFGYPIYGSDLPHIMKGFMEAQKPSQRKPTFIFCTQWKFSGDGARASLRYLGSSGFDIKWAQHFLMPSNICVNATSFFPYTNDMIKINKVLDKARKRIYKFAGNIAAERTRLKGFNPFSRALGCMQRVPFRKSFHKLRNDIDIDYERCINCGKCVKLCPSGNLFYDDDSIKAKGTCILCTRCYDFCPAAAIRYMKKSHNLKRGKTYKGPVENFNPFIMIKK